MGRGWGRGLESMGWKKRGSKRWQSLSETTSQKQRSNCQHISGVAGETALRCKRLPIMSPTFLKISILSSNTRKQSLKLKGTVPPKFNWEKKPNAECQT